eukprot:2331975-Pleurochrysis_carterae.AAC.1
MVGHTHEDIDALFKCVTDKWKSKKKVLAPSAFLRLLEKVIPDATVHSIMMYTHDWASFFRST